MAVLARMENAQCVELEQRKVREWTWNQQESGTAHGADLFQSFSYHVNKWHVRPPHASAAAHTVLC